MRKIKDPCLEQHAWHYNTGCYFFGSDAGMDDGKLNYTKYDYFEQPWGDDLVSEIQHSSHTGSACKKVGVQVVHF